jgi:voltage-gated potassium channel Kch
MFGLLIIIRRFLNLLLINKRLWKEDEEFRVLVIIMIAILLSGTAFFSLVENWSIIDSAYFCVMTIATIGYGDLAPSSPLSKIFTIIMALSGIGVFVGIVTKLAQALTQKGIERSHKYKNKS